MSTPKKKTAAQKLGISKPRKKSKSPRRRPEQKHANDDNGDDDVRLVDPLHHVYVRPSTLKNAGDGLFAGKDFAKDEIIIRYTGEQVTLEEMERRYPEGGEQPQYVLDTGQGTIIDARDPKTSSFARYINHKPISKKPNVKFHLNFDIFALRPIAKDSELFMNYGSEFHLKRKKRVKKAAK